MPESYSLQLSSPPATTNEIMCQNKRKAEDFPGATGANNLPANAGDTSSIPGLGRSHMPWSNKVHVPELLSPRAATSEVLMPTFCAPQEKPPQ